jgi:uncharacterized protein (DUF2336 family)
VRNADSARHALMTDSVRDQALALLEQARRSAQAEYDRLLDTATDLFLDAEARLSDEERRLMLGIMDRLVRDVEREVRAGLAERLSALPNAPRELVLKLAEDEVDIARPLILKSPVLRDDDLIELVRQRTREHRLCVAMRAGISAQVSQALIDSGDEDVIEALIRNDDAELALQAVNYLVEESRRVDRFREPLLERRDLPPALALRMFWWVSAALRRRILEGFKIDESNLDAMIQLTVQDAAAKIDRGPTAATKLARGLKDRGELTEANLIRMLRSGHVAAFTSGLAELAGIDTETAGRIMHCRGYEALAAACRGAGLNRQTFATIFMLREEARSSGRAQSPSRLEAALNFHDGLDRNQARNVLRYWSLDVEYLRAIAKLDSAGNNAAMTVKD